MEGSRYCFVLANPISHIDPNGWLTVDGWGATGMTSSEIKTWLRSQVSTTELALWGLNWSGTVEMNFSSIAQADPQRAVKARWLSGLILEGFRQNGWNETADHFDHWINGKGIAKPVKVDTFKATYSYKDLLMPLLRKECDALATGQSKTGVYDTNEKGRDQAVFLLLGDYRYNWTLKSTGKKCCECKIKVDDTYGFHSGKDASYTSTRTMPVEVPGLGIRQIEITGTVNIKDDVILSMKQVLGAQDFPRVTEWDVEINGTVGPVTPPPPPR